MGRQTVLLPRGIPRRTRVSGAQADDRRSSVTDNRTGKTYELPVTDGTVRAMDLRQIKTDADDFGLMAYDPAYMNTASCRSAITYIDGEAGILQHRGYPIEQLCEHSTYLEVAYLLINGTLPTQKQLDDWVHEITIHTFVHENVKDFMQGFRYDANPMGMLVASVGALSTFYPDADQIHDERCARYRSLDCSRRCRRWPRSRSGTTWGSPTCTPTTTSPTPATSSG